MSEIVFICEISELLISVMSVRSGLIGDVQGIKYLIYMDSLHIDIETFTAEARTG